jgi:L-ribulose-5-phosphate 3-epimerase
MKNKIGVVTSTYPNFKTDDALAGISAASFRYVELASAPSYFEHVLPRPESATEDDARKTVQLCKSYSLEISCIAGHTRLLKENGTENFLRVLDYAEKAGVPFVTTDVGEIKKEEDKKSFFKEIERIGDYARTKKVTVCLEMHGAWCNNGKTGAEIIKKVNHPNVRLNYDSGNVMLYGRVRPEDDIQHALPYMAFMHLKDDGGALGEWNFPALGDGNIDLDAILKSLKDYTGPISVEIEFDGKERTLEEINGAVRKSYAFLQSRGLI